MTQRHPEELPSIFGTIWERRRIAFSVAGAVIAAGIVYTLTTAPVWEAKATIIFPVRTPSLLGTTSFEQTSLAASLTGGPTPLKVFGGMIESENAVNLVAKETGLSKRRIKDMRTIKDQSTESSLTISVRDRDADLAKRVVQLHLDALKTINEKVSRPLVSADADILKDKLEVQKERVRQAEEKLLAFQKSAITAPSLATSGSGKDASIVPSSARWSEALRQLELEHRRVDSIIRDRESRTNAIAKQGGKLPSSLAPVQKWRERLTQLEYELKMQELTLAPEAPEVVKLRKGINITRRELQAELTKFAKATSAGMIDPNDSNGLPALLTERVAIEAQMKAVRKLAKIAPGEAIQLSRLIREVSVQGTILQQLQGQYELAALQADRDPSRWEVLDEPEVDEKPVNKSLTKNGALALIAGLFLGCLAALAWPRKRSNLSQPNEIVLDKAA